MASPVLASTRIGTGTTGGTGLRRFSLWVLLLIAGAFAFSDYWGYSTQYHSKPMDTQNLLDGKGLAPAQYRVGVLFAAKAVVESSHGHLAYRHVFAIFDFVFALLTLYLARAVLLRARSFREATPSSQWLRFFVLAGLAFYYLTWAEWYQRQETMACAVFVTASVYLLSAVRSKPLVAAGLVVLAVLQGFVRADVAILFHFALFLYVLFAGARGFLLGRTALLAVSFLGGLLPTAILWVMMHKVYPQASYGDTPVFQLVRNLSLTQLVPFLLFFLPTLYTFVKARGSDGVGDGQVRSLLLGAAFYFASWAVVGRLEEVRIFVPFALALMPLTANAVAAKVVPEQARREEYPVAAERAS